MCSRLNIKMLEEIIDKTSKEEKEFPKRLPSSHSKYVTRQTTFGRIRVDLPSKSVQRQMIDTLYKDYDPTNEQNRLFDERIWSLVDDDAKNNEHDIDFYGLINAHYRNNSFAEKLSSPKQEELTDNYIDQLAFPELTTKKSGIKSKPLQKETIKELQNEKMNFIDEQYFGTLKQIEYQQEQIDTNIPIKRIEMPPADDLNYIDQLVFTPSEKITQQPKSTPVENSDNLLDINFQFRISTPSPKRPTKSESNLNESPMDVYNPKLESMRSIKSKDYFDPPPQSSLDIHKDMDTAKTAAEPAGQIREQLTKKINDRDSLGYRTFENLIPKWWMMTKAEIVDILIKQICFVRRKDY
jgi:hypothetical protein